MGSVMTKTHVVEVEESKPVSTSEKQMLTNRAECIEKVHRYINSVVPVVMAQLEMGFKLTNGGVLYQKDKDRIDQVLSHASGGLSQGIDGRRASSAYVKSDEYSILLEVQDAYPSLNTNSHSSYQYYKKTVYLWNNQSHAKHDFEPMPFYTGEALILAKERLQVVNAIASKMNDEASGLKRLIGSNY